MRITAFDAALCARLMSRHAWPAFPPSQEVATAVGRIGRRAPWTVRTVLLLLRATFKAEAVFRYRRRFARLGAADQQALIARWRARPAPFPLFIHFMETLVILRAYSPAALEPHMAAPTVRPAGIARCEWAVVGSGPGGAVTAAVLAESGRDVLALEEGPDPAAVTAAPFSFDEMERLFQTAGLAVSIGRAPVSLVEGRCVGGGSSVNSGLYCPPPADLLAEWRAGFGVVDCSPEALQADVDACRAALSVGHYDGPLPRASAVLADGGRALGWPVVVVPKMRRYERGTPWSDGERAPYQPMTKSFLPRLAAAGGRLAHGCRVTAVRRQGTGWRLESAAGPMHADRIVLAGGALQTPLLLRRSGFRGSIGDNLGLQLIIKLVARFDEVVNAPDLGMPGHQVKLSAPPVTLGCGISTPAQLALCLKDRPRALAALHEIWPHLAIYTITLAARARGAVRALPCGSAPMVRFAPSAQDWRDLAEGQRQAARLLFAAGAREIYPAGLGPVIRDPSGIDALPPHLACRRPPLLALHLSSTCAMGEVGGHCVTDSYGRLRGAEGLYVADASLLCTPPGVNPQGTIMAFAHRNARRMAELTP